MVIQAQKGQSIPMEDQLSAKGSLYIEAKLPFLYHPLICFNVK